MPDSRAQKNKVRGGKNWISEAIGKPGTLHKQMGIKMGNKIPLAKLKSASHKGGKLGKRANLALTLRKFH